MGRLVNGEWVTQWIGADTSGRFQRSETLYRDTVSAEPGARFTPDPDRYHLYVGLACPWAHRVTMMRSLLGLERVLPMSIVEPLMGEGGWSFNAEIEGATPDQLHGTNYLREVYLLADPKFTGRVTVPLLWDTHHNTIVNNESREIARILDHGFASLAERPVDLAPAAQRPEIERLIDLIYEPVNNGVYRTGFASSQMAYDEAVRELFDTLDTCEGLLAERRWLAGERPSEVDLFLFATLVRFDHVYNILFKCNRQRVADYPNLWAFVRELYQVPRIRATVNFEHICEHYYRSHVQVNPKRIRAVPPALDFEAPHGRAQRGGVAALELFG